MPALRAAGARAQRGDHPGTRGEQGSSQLDSRRRHRGSLPQARHLMLSSVYTPRFNRDLRRMEKRGKDLSKLRPIIATLLAEDGTPADGAAVVHCGRGDGSPARPTARTAARRRPKRNRACPAPSS
jgi:hypothetical protein